MGAFQTGFKMGGDLYADSERDKQVREELRMRGEDQRLRQAADARAQQEHDNRMADRARVDAAYASYDGLDQPTAGGPTPGTFARMDRGMPEDFEPQRAGARATGPEADLAREQALERIAVASRDPNAIRASATAQRAHRQSTIAADAARRPLAEITAQLPELNTNRSGYPILYTGKDKNGYTFLTTDETGAPGQKVTMNEAQVRQFYLAHQLGEAGFGAEAMATLSAVNKDLGDHIGKWNATMQAVATTGNDATHKGNQDVIEGRKARAQETSAGASAALAQTHGLYYQEQIKDLKDNREHNAEARQLAAQFDALSPQDQAGAAGQALRRRFNMLNAKPGGTLGAEAGAGRLPQTLTDAQKILLTKAVDEISLLTPDKDTGQIPVAKVAAIYRKYGLDPAQFNVESPLDRALREHAARQAGGQPAGAQAPGQGRSLLPALPQMTTTPGALPFRGNAAAIRDAERRQN